MKEKEYIFEAEIKKPDGPGHYVEFPYNIEECFGTKGRVPVVCTFDDVEYRGSLMKMEEGNHIIGVLKDILHKIEKQAGDTVKVILRKDEQAKTVTIPDELDVLLKENPEEMEFFETLSYSNKKAYCDWIGGAKQEETKKTRAGKGLEMLKRKQKILKT